MPWSGSLNEKDNQRGIAHYLEHMAFNGSQNFAPGSVVDFFQSMGLTFGRDQNAFTSFDQTVFQLSFPDTKPETIEKGIDPTLVTEAERAAPERDEESA